MIVFTILVVFNLWAVYQQHVERTAAFAVVAAAAAGTPAVSHTNRRLQIAEWATKGLLFLWLLVRLLTPGEAVSSWEAWRPVYPHVYVSGDLVATTPSGDGIYLAEQERTGDLQLLELDPDQVSSSATPPATLVAPFALNWWNPWGQIKPVGPAAATGKTVRYRK